MGRLHHKSSVRDSIVNTLIPGVAVSGLTGLAVGVCVFFYKWGADALHRISDQLYESVRAHLVYLPLFLLGLIALACLMNLIIKWEPAVAGGGIARAEGVMRGLFPIRSLPTFFGAIGASMTGFFAGLPLGSEGPSVLIGTSLGGMFNRLAPGKRAWRRYTLTAGGAAFLTLVLSACVSTDTFQKDRTEMNERMTALQAEVVRNATLLEETRKEFRAFQAEAEAEKRKRDLEFISLHELFDLQEYGNIPAPVIGRYLDLITPPPNATRCSTSSRPPSVPSWTGWD